MLGNILLYLVQEDIKQWCNILSQAEFAYNNVSNWSSGKSSFEAIYIRPPSHTQNLPRMNIIAYYLIDKVANIHREVRRISHKVQVYRG